MAQTLTAVTARKQQRLQEKCQDPFKIYVLRPSSGVLGPIAVN